MSATTAVILIAPEGEHGEAAESGWLGVPSIVWQALNLTLFLVLLWYLLRKPIAKFFGDRRTAVEEATKKADADRRRAEELASEISARLTRIETEIRDLKERAARNTDKERAELSEQAEEDARRLSARATADVESRARELRKELTGHAGDLAVELAGQIVRKSLTAGDSVRLVQDGVAGLKAVAAAKGR